MDLFDHIKLEYQLNSDSLLESYGIVNGLDEILDPIYERVSDIIKSSSENDVIFSGEIVIDGNESTFYDRLILDLDIDTSSNPHRDAVYDYDCDDYVRISASLYGSKLYILSECKSLFAHELTHAYEDISRKNNEPDYKRSTLKGSLDDYYTLALAIKKNKKYFLPITNKLMNIIYWLSPAEQNANLGRLETEINDVAHQMFTYRWANLLVNKTELYSEFLSIKSDMNDVHKFSESDIMSIVKDINSKVNGIELTPNIVKQLIKKFTIFLDRFEDKLKSNAARMSYDLYQKRKIDWKLK